jgi:hypothetical protein
MKSMAEILGWQANNYHAQLATSAWRNRASNLIRTRGAFCECCRQGNKVLQAHHICYTPNTRLEDEPDENFMVLCRSCHTQITDRLREFRKFVFRHLNPQQFQVLNGGLLVGLTEHDATEFVHAVAEMAASPGSVKRFAYSYDGGKPV